MPLKHKTQKVQKSTYSTGLYERIATGLAARPAYLLIFAVSALFFLSGTVTTAKAVISNDLRFGILALVSFVIAIGAAIIVVREIEGRPVPETRISAGRLDRDANSAQGHERLPVDPPRAGKLPEPLDQKDERALLAELNLWTVKETEDKYAEGGLKRELHRLYEFETFEAAFSFMRDVTDRAILPYNHHPRWQNTYTRVEVWLTTFNLGCRLSIRDRRLAKLFEQIWEEHTKNASKDDLA
jgi:pterin-4a-carbinolamine dehydratase